MFFFPIWIDFPRNKTVTTVVTMLRVFCGTKTSTYHVLSMVFTFHIHSLISLVIFEIETHKPVDTSGKE